MVIEAAELHWLNGIPYSVHFAEPYFSLDDGLARIEPVFLHAHQLAARFSTLESHTSFTIAEIGFGTGVRRGNYGNRHGQTMRGCILSLSKNIP